MNKTWRDKKRLMLREDHISAGTLIPLPDTLVLADYADLSHVGDKWLLELYTQGGYDCVSLSLGSVLSWIKDNHPEVFKSVLPKE